MTNLDCLNHYLEKLDNCDACKTIQTLKSAPVMPLFEQSLKAKYGVVCLKFQPSEEEGAMGYGWTDSASMYVVNLIHKYIPPTQTYFSTIVKCVTPKKPKVNCQKICISLYLNGELENIEHKYLLIFGREAIKATSKYDIPISCDHTFDFEAPFNIMMSSKKEQELISCLKSMKGTFNV